MIRSVQASDRRTTGGGHNGPPGRGRQSRALGAVVDQAFSSLTNFVILFAALRTLSISGVGVFTFAYTLMLLGVTVVRALALEPLTIRFTTADSATRRRAVGQAAGASLAIGLAILVLAVIVGLGVGHGLSGALAGFGVAAPALLVQDAWRIALFASGRAWSAALNDASCLAATIVVVAVVVRVDVPINVPTLLLCWAGGLSAGVILGAAQLHTAPHLRQAWNWLRTHRDIGPALAGERSAESSAAQLSLLLVGITIGTAALGQLGAARALMAPVTTLTTSLTAFGLPEAARLRDQSRLLVRFAAALSVTTTLGVLTFTGLLLIAPDWLGRSLAGRNWADAKTLLIPVAIWTAASGARAGPALALRTYERAQSLFKLSILTGVVVLLATSIGSLLGGVRGAAWAFGSVYLLAVMNYWATFLRARHAREGTAKPSRFIARTGRHQAEASNAALAISASACTRAGQGGHRRPRRRSLLLRR